MILLDNQQLLILHGLQMAKLLEHTNPSAAEYVRNVANQSALHRIMSTYENWESLGNRVNLLHSIFQ